MPLIGWIGGYMIRDFVVSIDHWIAFLLLGFLGAKMIYEGFSDDEDEKTETDWKHIFIMGVATSIDALAIGVSFALLPVNIFSAAGLIGGITFALCAIGVEIGRKKQRSQEASSSSE
jgi:putative Mn2+ efflux pump MntP